MYVTKGEKRNGSFQINGFTLGELLVVILIRRLVHTRDFSRE